MNYEETKQKVEAIILINNMCEDYHDRGIIGDESYDLITNSLIKEAKQLKADIELISEIISTDIIIERDEQKIINLKTKWRDCQKLIKQLDEVLK